MKVKKTDINQFAPEKFWNSRTRNFEETDDFVVSRETTKALPNLFHTDDIKERNVFTDCELTKKNLHEVQKRHAETLEKGKTKRHELNQQWMDLEKTELEFRDNFKFFDKFVRENEMKRKRASQKIGEMKNCIKKRSEDIDTVKNEIEELKYAKLRMDSSIQKLRIFEVTK